MIDYVDAMLRTWGIAKRKLDGISGKATKDQKDGLYPCGNARSFMGRFREGGHVGGGKGVSRLVEPMEGLTGDALAASIGIQKAMKAGLLDDKGYEQIYVQYVLRPRNNKKFKYFGMKKHEYYTSLHNLQVRLSSWFST